MMKGTKELLADVLFNSKVVHLFKRLPLRNKLVVLNYHRIRPADPQFRSEFDDRVYTVDETEFARQIKWLKKYTRILSENDLIELRSESGLLNPGKSTPCVVITFDDGYRDNYDIALPILKHYEAPAILFVTTQMINSRRVGWWDVIAYLIKKCKKPCIQFEGRKFQIPNQKERAVAFFQQRMKHAQYEQTKYLLSELSEACDVQFPDAALQEREILTWEELREMARHRIAIGSHTHSHRVFSTIDANAQKEEMILSKLILEEKIAKPVFSISYPVGELRFITGETPGTAEASGYVLGFTSNTGVNGWKNIHPYLVKRIARLLDKGSIVSLLTVLPELFTWDSAEAFQIKAMETHPTYADAYYRLGIVHLGKGKIDEAIANFKEAVRFNPNYTEARIKLGISQAFDGRYAEAEKNLKMILDNRPGFADVHYHLGIVYACDKKIPQAIERFERAIEINPAYKDAFLKLGILYCHRKRYDLALNMLEDAGRLDPADSDLRSILEVGRRAAATHANGSSPDVTSLFAAYFGGNDRMDALIAEFISHLGISPNLSDIMAIVEKGDFPRETLEILLDLFQEYKSTFPEYADIRYMLGVLFRKLGRHSDAEGSFKQSLRLNPNYVKARMSLFLLLKEQKRYTEALEHGYSLDRLKLPYPDLFCGLGEALHALYRHSEAERFLKKALALNPKYAAARQALQRIEEDAGG